MSKEITNNDLFEFMTKMYEELTGKIDGVNTKMDEGFKELKKEVAKTNMVIENDIRPKINALYDGYSQVYEKVTDLEDKLDKQDDYVFRRVK